MNISIITKIKNFIKALYNHIITGMKKCSQKQINQRYDVCLSCEHYSMKKDKSNDIYATCNLCGCNLSNKKVFMNKLAWKDQKCPANKW